MRKLREKVAVITGAASGIGRALAARFGGEGMSLVLADIEREALAVVGAEMRARGIPTLGVQTDVSRVDEVERLAQRALDRFGSIDLLCNNAGVGIVGPAIWECTQADMDWVLGVNLFGVLHGLRVFVPIMLEQGTEGHIVNTASAAGLLSPSGMGLDGTSKAGVVTLSEALHHELALRGSLIHVSVVCPGPVRTRIAEAARNRPASLRNDAEFEAARQVRHGPELREMREVAESGMAPDDLARQVFEAVRHERFYVFPHAWVKEALCLRMENLLGETDPWRGSTFRKPEG